jgi:proteasome accessory factor A
MQWEYLDRTLRYARTRGFPPEVDRAIGMWEHLLTGLEKDPMTLSREVDWVAKLQLLDQYSARHDLPLSSPRMSLIDLAYHDVNRQRGLYYILERRGLMDRVVTDGQIDAAMTAPPATTRARLRGDFIKAAKLKKRDFTVDWVHLKLNDQAQRTIVCKDPFRAVDERVEKLIASL